VCASIGLMEKFKYLLLLTSTAAIVALDQATKIYIHTHYRLGESTSVIEDYFNITYVRNPGAAFGFLAKSNPAFRENFFLILPPLLMAVILWLLRGTPFKERVQVIALCLVFGGALGNYIDRIQHGFVIDFLDFHYKGVYSWPAFNVADITIVTGISLMVLMSFLEQKKSGKAKA